MTDYETKKAVSIEEAERLLESHEYTPIFVDDEKGEEIWRCAKPQSSTHGFDIVVTRFGIAMMGDIGPLVFTVGLTYGMPFLAGTDVEYYIYSKLEHVCKEKEFDKEAITQTTVEYIVEELRSRLPNPFLMDTMADEVDTNIVKEPAWLKEDSEDTATLEDLRGYVDVTYHALPMNNSQHEFFEELMNFLDNVECWEEARQAYDDLTDSTFLQFDDSWEWTYDKPKECLIATLYMLNTAAKKIMEIKKAAKEKEKAEES